MITSRGVVTVAGKNGILMANFLYKTLTRILSIERYGCHLLFNYLKTKKKNHSLEICVLMRLDILSNLTHGYSAEVAAIYSWDFLICMNEILCNNTRFHGPGKIKQMSKSRHGLA